MALAEKNHRGNPMENDSYKNVTFTPGEIKQIREALKLTQEEFAQAMGATTTSISRWERGTIPGGPSRMAIMLLKRMAKEAGLSHLIIK